MRFLCCQHIYTSPLVWLEAPGSDLKRGIGLVELISTLFEVAKVASVQSRTKYRGHVIPRIAACTKSLRAVSDFLCACMLQIKRQFEVYSCIEGLVLKKKILI
jgi:hypothetical protein